MREIVLDTETTGLDPQDGHRIVEIGAVELYNHVPTGNVYHQYINPLISMPDQAFAIHGLSDEFLSDKPKFSEIAKEFLDFIGSAKLVIHNAAFDIKFINAELKSIDEEVITFDRATDTLAIARKKFPGSPASLDSLCRRFKIDNSARVVHGALLDSQILAEVYLELVGGKQPDFALNIANVSNENNNSIFNEKRAQVRKEKLKSRLTTEEKANHENFIKKLGKNSMWSKILNS
jgi:DNA polymerase III, epsilon subunit, Proteobacterial